MVHKILLIWLITSIARIFVLHVRRCHRNDKGKICGIDYSCPITNEFEGDYKMVVEILAMHCMYGLEVTVENAIQ